MSNSWWHGCVLKCFSLSIFCILSNWAFIRNTFFSGSPSFGEKKMSDHIVCILQSCFQWCHIPILLARRVNWNDLLMLLKELLESCLLIGVSHETSHQCDIYLWNIFNWIKLFSLPSLPYLTQKFKDYFFNDENEVLRLCKTYFLLRFIIFSCITIKFFKYLFLPSKNRI